MKILAMIAGLISAGLWFWSAWTRIPARTIGDIENLESSLQRVGYINAAAAFFSGLTAILSVFSN
jgi:hypothetical protein